MSPSAISTTPKETVQTSELTAAAVASKLAQTTTVAPQKTNGSTLAPLDASTLKFTRNPNPKEVPALDDPIRDTSSFCTDHMVTAVWTASAGWAQPELRPYGPLSIMPTASCLHYATECFEGMKAYRGYDGKLRIFRPELNTGRFLRSAARISLPGFEPLEVEKLILALMEVDGPKFLPRNDPGKFIYLRPTLIGSHPGLGVQSPREATLFIIATYMAVMSEPPNGMRLLASQNDTVRAWPGGFGFAKVGANYGPSLMATSEARERGYDQILWLFGEDGKVTEAGASNFLVVWRSREGKLQLQTAPLGDKIILDGVTRRSVLELARERISAGNKFGLEPLEIVEETFTMGDVVDAVKEGRMVEAFACGTAYFVCAVSTINYQGKDYDLPMVKGNSGEYTATLKNWLKDIMYGREDHKWGVVVNEK